MKNLFFFFVFFLFCSCHDDKEVIKGDLCFKLVNLLPAKGFDRERASEIEKMLDRLNMDSVKNAEQRTFYEDLAKLKRNKLLTTPYIDVRLKDGEVKKIFLSLNEYKKMEKFTLDYLTKNNKKLQVVLKVKSIEKDILYSNEVVDFEELNGKTFFNK